VPARGRADAAQRILRGGEKLRRQSHNASKLLQRLPAALIIDQVSDVLGQDRFPAISRRRRMCRTSDLLKPVQQHVGGIHLERSAGDHDLRADASAASAANTPCQPRALSGPADVLELLLGQRELDHPRPSFPRVV
jgi:hypothetical protein